tara:strand:- start:503 stop:691 length:189 start_codon:yes stop_codon:yes gene_type:complete
MEMDENVVKYFEKYGNKILKPRDERKRFHCKEELLNFIKEGKELEKKNIKIEEFGNNIIEKN